MTATIGSAPTSSVQGPGQAARLSVRGLQKTYGSGASAKQVIADLSFDVGAGEFVCIVGPSGVGKTTLLKCLSGLTPASGGEARLDGVLIDGPPRQMALVFQDYTRSLAPWLTVEKNVLLPLRGSDLRRRERMERVHRAIEEVNLTDALHKYPWQLSGGMQQRVAIARALAYQPEVLLMDEPFASLDAQTRFDLEDLLLRLRAELGITVVFVTHDIDESVYLADRVVVLGSSPCRVLEIVDVPLPSPRDQLSTRAHPTFTRLRTHVLQAIRH
ncbi:ABC transporter ATP-binding protein [Blastococcus sp. SYSU D00820]